MSTAHGKSLRLTAILVLLVWTTNNGSNGLAGALAAAPAVVVLGDSTVDAGVNSFINTIVRADWPPYGRDFPGHQSTGRFCDGKLITDVLAEFLGYPPPYQLPFNDPNAEGSVLLGGISTASSGSGFWDTTLRGICVSLSQQVEWVGEWKKKVVALVGDVSAASIVGEAIFIIATGSNDWINNYFNDPSLMQKYDIMQYTQFIVGIAQNRIQDLYNLGARRVVLVSLPPMGCVPVETIIRNTGGKCIDLFNTAATTFNGELQNFLGYLQGTLPGGTIMYFDSYSQVYEAYTNPAQYGIVNTNTTQVCCSLAAAGSFPAFGPLCNQGSAVCSNADEYLWWDGFHTTQFFNQRVGTVLFALLQSKLGI